MDLSMDMDMDMEARLIINLLITQAEFIMLHQQRDLLMWCQ